MEKRSETHFDPADSEALLKVVIVGHVDHGKSTILGRLLADTDSLPKGKLEEIRLSCQRNSKPFEYAFLLDALKNERSQGITIDMARCFFRTRKRKYMVIDAPGHIEFLKNMVTGAARADAALLVIDAAEGIRENSRRHGYMLSILGVPQIAVLVNKIDLVGYSKEVYDSIVKEYSAFLNELGVKAASFIPVSGREGDNIASASERMPWYEGSSALGQMEAFKPASAPADGPLRIPVQDIYKFTENGDDRRIVAGTILSGSLKTGDELVFLPSGKTSVVKDVEEFNAPKRDSAQAPQAVGFTVNTQIYARPGEIACRKGEPLPLVGSRFKANVFWLSKNPLVPGRRYKLKLAAARVSAELVDVLSVLDASSLGSVNGRKRVDRHDVGLCVFETSKPLAFDKVSTLSSTGRFVIVDNYEIAGGGVVLDAVDAGASALEERVRKREANWDSGIVAASRRSERNRHPGKTVIFVGPEPFASTLAKKTELALFEAGASTYYLGLSNLSSTSGLGDASRDVQERDGSIETLGEMARAMTDAGLVFISSAYGLDDYELQKLKLVSRPYEFLIVELGQGRLSKFVPDLRLTEESPLGEALPEVLKLLAANKLLPEYVI